MKDISDSYLEKDLEKDLTRNRDVFDANARLEELEKLEKREIPEVNGFDKSGVLTTDEVKNYLATEFPKVHLENIPKIDYTDNFVKANENHYVAGTHDPETGEIEVYRQSPDGNYDSEEMKRTISHEVGHDVYNHLDPEIQSKWNELSDDRKTEDCVSERATVSAKEDFAETYADYMRDPLRLELTNFDKEVFMSKYIFNGREYEPRGI